MVVEASAVVAAGVVVVAVVAAPLRPRASDQESPQLYCGGRSLYSLPRVCRVGSGIEQTDVKTGTRTLATTWPFRAHWTLPWT